MRLAIDHILTSMKLSDRTDRDQRASNQLSRIATECVAEGHDDPKQRKWTPGHGPVQTSGISIDAENTQSDFHITRTRYASCDCSQQRAVSLLTTFHGGWHSRQWSIWPMYALASVPLRGHELYP
jgi:hypothetical protein